MQHRRYVYAFALLVSLNAQAFDISVMYIFARERYLPIPNNAVKFN